MNIRELLWEAARSETQRALPILSFPAVQKMDATVGQLVKDAELQAQAMEIVARDTDTLAAVSLMDLSVEAEAFGAQVRFAENEVPAVTGQLVADEDDADALEVPDLEAGRAKICAEGVRLAKQRIRTKPVLAGMIGPYSLAGRLMDVTEILYICYDEPETVHKVLEKATAYLIRYGGLLKETGADGIVLAEPLAGILSPDMAEEFSVRPLCEAHHRGAAGRELWRHLPQLRQLRVQHARADLCAGRRGVSLRQCGRDESCARRRAGRRAVYGQYRPGRAVCHGHAGFHPCGDQSAARGLRRLQTLCPLPAATFPRTPSGRISTPSLRR